MQKSFCFKVIMGSVNCFTIVVAHRKIYIAYNRRGVLGGDYNNDGFLDILLTGRIDDNYSTISKIYKNNGNGTFTEQTSISLPGSQICAAWGDYNNDGYLDILLNSNFPKLFKNNGNGTFTELTTISLANVSYMTTVDYNNDGFLDVLLNANINGTRYSKIYKNTGDGTFVEQATNLAGISEGCSAWGDYNNDGFLDILITGWTNNYFTASKVYKNNGNGTFSEQTNISLQGSSYGAAAWGDYDNDGNLDILLTGEFYFSKIYRNNGNGTFTEQAFYLPGLVNGAVAWGDYNKDGKLDFLLAGYDGNNRRAYVYTNNINIQNTIPVSPINLSHTINGSIISFNWSKSTDSQTPQNGLHYNIVVGTSPNSVNTISPMSIRETGYRQVVRYGNAQSNSLQIKNLPVGNYYWSVQAIDGAFAGSQFASEETFSILPPPSMTLISPIGGENWRIGSTQNIMWTSTSISNVKLEYTTNNGSDWMTIITSASASSGAYAWTVPNTPSIICKVRISDASNPQLKDESSSTFTIFPMDVTVTVPNGGENWFVGTRVLR